MENENLIKNIEELINNVSNIQKKLYDDRKANKGNFNFFDAIVSGKHEKHHIEKYHSNFIAYLLDPKGSHDFGTLFLEKFLNVINNKNPIQDLKFYSLERERQIDNGRFIDISLEYGKESIIFIENKISSEELEEQVSDYYSFADKNFDNVIAIYLTLNGDKPNSIDDDNIVCLSYEQIKKWIELCVKDERVIQHSHIVSALEQYIKILNKLLNNMKEETKQIIDELLKNKEATKFIIEHFSVFNDSIFELVKIVRNKFEKDLNTTIEKMIIPEGIKINILQLSFFKKYGEFGMFFNIVNNDKEKIDYGGKADGGKGDAILIEGKSAHIEIDETNSILLEAYDNKEKWANLVNESSNEIFKIINEKVKPFLEKEKN